MAHIWRSYQVQKPRVTLTVKRELPLQIVLTAEAPADTSAVEFFSGSRSLGTAKAAPFTLALPSARAADSIVTVDMGVQTVFAVATTPAGKTPSRPLTLVAGKPIDWKTGDADQKAAEAPLSVIRLSPEHRSILQLAVTPTDSRKPAAEQLAPVRQALETLAKDPFVEQRDAAAKLLKALDAN
jgi:hypothetical protein